MKGEDSEVQNRKLDLQGKEFPCNHRGVCVYLLIISKAWFHPGKDDKLLAFGVWINSLKPPGDLLRALDEVIH